MNRMPGLSSLAGRLMEKRPSSDAAGRARRMLSGKRSTGSSVSRQKVGYWIRISMSLATGQAINVTAVERVSFYNGGLFFWPSDSTKLGFTALIDGNSHPFRMDRDGRNKVDLTKESKEFAYGFSSSRDGQRIAYHKDYQVFLAHADGSHAFHVETGQPFNFADLVT